MYRVHFNFCNTFRVSMNYYLDACCNICTLAWENSPLAHTAPLLEIMASVTMLLACTILG